MAIVKAALRAGVAVILSDGSNPERWKGGGLWSVAGDNVLI
jgi:hypothetical protein